MRDFRICSAHQLPDPSCHICSVKIQGPAYHEYFTQIAQPIPSLTLHEWAALLALQGLLADPKMTGGPEHIVEIAWDFSDAFMIERAKRLKDAEEKKP